MKRQFRSLLGHTAKAGCCVCLIQLLVGCASGPQPSLSSSRSYQGDGAPGSHPDLDAIPDAVPRHEPRTRAGNPDSYDVLGNHYVVLKDSHGYAEQGVASWYGTKFHGHKTSNGETYDMYAMTAAHKTLPIPCYVRVTNLENGKGVTLRVNDRGPFHDGRIIDLSYVAAYKLGILGKGTGYVEVSTVEPGDSLPHTYTAAATPPVRESPAPRRETTPTPASAAAGELMFVQVGAFSDPANARKLHAELSARHLAQAHVRPLVRDNGTLYRVQLGPVAGIGQAQELANRLGAIGITGARFVVEADNWDESMLQ